MSASHVRPQFFALTLDLTQPSLFFGSTTARRSSSQPNTEAHPSSGKQKPKTSRKFTIYGKLRPRNGNFYGISSMGQSRALPEHTWTAKQF